MKKLIFLLFTNCLLLIAYSQSAYDHREAFSPLFYEQNGNQYRSASGEPGPAYWQNRADVPWIQKRIKFLAM